MPSHLARRHIFLVGCPRSGTTLLQSLLASHPEIDSFPESHFFTHLHPNPWWARQAGLISRRAAARLDAFTEAIGWPDRVRPRLPFARSYARAFIHLLDTITRQNGKSAWLEKTPEHIKFIDDIQALVPDAVFIHIVRNGPDVIASLYAATNDSSFKGFGVPLSLDQCIDRWCTDIELTRREIGKPNHLLIRYEALVGDPAPVLKQICAFLGFDFDERMLDSRRAAAERVILPWEHWKSGALAPIRNANGTKLNESLSAAERDYVHAKTDSIEIP